MQPEIETVHSNETIAAEGLAIEKHSGKWRVAKIIAAKPMNRTDSKALLPYWERVRAYFIELGGTYL